MSRPAAPVTVEDFSRNVADFFQNMPADLGWSEFKHSAGLFVDAVNWSEPWLSGVLAFHVATFVVVVAGRRRASLQTGLFFGLLALAFASSWLNGWAHEHWRQFAEQNYFDPAGLFACVVWAGPLLFNAFCVLINLLLESCALLVKVKRLELEKRKRVASKKSK